MNSDILFTIFSIFILIILIIGLILWKTDQGDGKRKTKARNFIYGPLSQPFHGLLAKVFELPLSKGEKIGWLIVMLLGILGFLMDYFIE